MSSESRLGSGLTNSKNCIFRNVWGIEQSLFREDVGKTDTCSPNIYCQSFLWVQSLNFILVLCLSPHTTLVNPHGSKPMIRSCNFCQWWILGWAHHPFMAYEIWSGIWELQRRVFKFLNTKTKDSPPFLPPFSGIGLFDAGRHSCITMTSWLLLSRKMAKSDCCC